MHAAVMIGSGDPEVLQYQELPDLIASSGEVRIDVRAIGIQGGDLGKRRNGEVPQLPHIVGYQASGVVSGLGADVTMFAVGDRVVAQVPFGSHASQLIADAVDVYVLDDRLSFDDAACVPAEFGTASEALFHRAHLQAGENVLILGPTGGVGRAAVQLARAAGARIIGVSSRPATLRTMGLDIVIDSSSSDWPQLVRDATAGVGVDLVFDPIGGGFQTQALASLRHGGRIAWLGRAGGAKDNAALHQLMLSNAALLGVHYGNAKLADPERLRTDAISLLGRVAEGELTVSVDKRFPLSDAAGAHRYAESGAATGRVLIIPEG